MSEWLNDFVNSTSGLIILAILATCTIRDIIAFTGIIPREKKYIGRIIYGKYDEDLIARSLMELGCSRKEAQGKYKKLKEYIKDMEGTTTVTKENAPIHLVLLLAKYIVEFETSIKYGNSESNYYINTMEIVHDRKDSRILCDVMYRLIYSTKQGSLGAIFAPKSGNPLLAEKLAECLNIPSVLVKDSQEKSKLYSDNENNTYRINFEGISQIKNIDGSLQYPVIDCNISGGSQIQKAIEEVNREKTLGIKITDIFILFRVDDEKKDTETTFQNLGVRLHRYFDLDEKIKKDIYQIKKNAEREGRFVDIENKDDYRQARTIIDKLKSLKKYHYCVEHEKRK